MNPVEIIKLKRNKHALTRQHIDFFITGYLEGKIPEYQMSALLMAIYFNGMTDEETYFLTEAILYSGKVIDLNFINGSKVDKHSTGGVGDKISLILAPLVAACGIYVPMISGRGLGHTGGTLDKLESIPGFRIQYSIDEFKKILSETGLVMNGQTGELAPADKRIYALRDVTATVENVSLITASIMSKKIAEGADGLVFDVKIGNGSNLPDYDLSLKLAKNLLEVSKKFGKKAIAVLTAMDEPLGNKIGNWLEVEESLEILNGINIPDSVKVNNVLCGAMIYLGGKASSIEEGEKIAHEKISDGSALNKFYEMVSVQSGDLDYVKDWKNLKRPAYSKTVNAKSAGYVTEMKAIDFGFAAIDLGCGRKKTDDELDYLAGIILNKKVGDEVKQNETICEIFAEEESKLFTAEERIHKAVKFSDKKPEPKKLIIDILQ
ncbi:MAG: thymidine phosphorylase [Bacteroidetes bacterium]|nr:thymidine phosphorylase [Bacteroidota bacterium]